MDKTFTSADLNSYIGMWYRMTYSIHHDIKNNLLQLASVTLNRLFCCGYKHHIQSFVLQLRTQTAGDIFNHVSQCNSIRIQLNR
ncbi:hypothetical protein D3C76_1707150 [compost metagenome]